ncbi:MAG TPA: putative glycoside hydrolase, partial [Methanomassiliicoccaceae archaeon]|nr:putative glycoside hydrolase [Methanomassiliicoccaceae archaeon]
MSFSEPVRARTVPRPKEFPARGLYMNPSSAGTRFIFESARRLRELGGNTIVFDAKDDLGAITYPSSIPGRYCPEEKYHPNIEDLHKLIEFLHRMDIHVVARVVAFRDPIMSRNHPSWCIDREHHWLDPAHPEVQEYLLTVIRELSDTGVDEIQLDYIRYHADGKVSTGIEGVQRTDVIASFLKRVREITAPRGVLLSVDMFGIVIWQRNVDMLVVGQDIAKMKPYVDIISPMLYPSHFSPGFDGVKNPADEPYRFVYRGVKRMKELVGDEVVIRPWLQSFPLRVTRGFDADYIRSQIDAARDAGGTGWLLWSPGNHYGEAYSALHKLMHPEPAVRQASSGALPGALPEQPLPAGAAPGAPLPPGAEEESPGNAP